MYAEGATFTIAQPVDTARFFQPYDTVLNLPGLSKSLPPDVVQKTLIPEEQTLVINEFMASNGTVLADEFDEFDDWIEIFNFGEQPVNINGLYITDDTDDPGKHRVFPGTGSYYLQPGDYILFWADGQPEQGIFHLGFKLSAEGEGIAIYTSADQLLIDSLTYSQQYYDVSKGRQPDGGETWNYFLTPSPGTTNSTEGFLDKVDKPQFSYSGGCFSDPIQVEMMYSEPGSVTHYTTNGSVPTQSSPLFNGLLVGSTVTFRAKSFRAGYLPSDVITHTFLFEQDLSLDVVSIVSDSLSLWGANGILTHPYSGLEKIVSMELLKTNGITGFSVDAGIKIHAPDGQPQQSLKLSMRPMYGEDDIEYPLFPGLDISSFKRLILRNGGNDGSQLANQRTHFRDPLMHIISAKNGANVGTSAYKPVHLYLNGKYWGIYNIREKIDKYYIQSHYGSDDIDLLERSFGYEMNENAIEGDWDHFHYMKTFADTADLGETANYAHMKSMMDINIFSEYWIYVVYYGNFDWLSNNMKFWRSRDPAGKWRWIHWDLDHGLGLPYYYYSDPSWNTLAWSTSLASDRPWNGYNTILIRNLLENEEFRNGFINRFADLLNSAFKPEMMMPVVDSLATLLDNDIPGQFERWGSTYTIWQNALEGIRNYINNRPDFVWEHLAEKFDLEEPNKLILNVMPENAGEIEVNYITVNQFPWEGKYFEEIPISIRAIPYEGYQLYGWNGNDTATAEVTFTLDTNLQYTAFFTASTGEKEIFINEINYNSSESFEAGDWVELYNPNPWETSLAGYSLKDSQDEHTYFIKGNPVIRPYGYFVLSQDTMKLAGLFSDLVSVTGNFNFGFSSDGESIRLFDETGTLIDTVCYMNTFPWPEQPDGGGSTLELIEHNPNNDLPENWQASYIIGGTPGLPNSELGVGIPGLPESNPLVYIHPNPGEGIYYLTFTVQVHDPFELRIFNLMGQQLSVRSRQVSDAGGQIRIDIRNQPDGIYIISISVNGTKENLKVIKSTGY